MGGVLDAKGSEVKAWRKGHRVTKQEENGKETMESLEQR